MLGMILLAVLAVMIFFGITAGYFEKMGVANWVAFLIVLAFAVAAVFPPLVTGGGVSLSYAGFFLPLLLGVVCMFALGANSTLVRAVIGTMAIAGIVIASRVALVPSDYRSSIPSVLIVGFVSGFASFLICRTRLAVLAATLVGIVLGDFITAMIFRFAVNGTGLFALGQNGIFDCAVLASLVGGFTVAVAELIMRAARSRVRAPALAQTEAAEDNDLPESEMIPPHEDDDLFDEYFNDDID